MRSSFVQTVAPLWHTYSSPGAPLRSTSDRAMRVIYGLWLTAFILKLIGSGWDIAWHFHYLRDDMAPPHIINTIGTMLAVGLAMFHTWTGYGVDRLSLRLIQAGVGTFLLAIPLDLINHRLFGLDITAWSPTHAMLYLGTAVMIMGVLRGWWLLGPAGKLYTTLALGFWAFLLEDVMFPIGQQEYGVLALDALKKGQSTAAPELVAAAGINPELFIVPVPGWVYPLWMILTVTMVLLAARIVIGKRWTATTVTGLYLAYRLGSYYLLVAGGFPPSYIPMMLLGVAVAIDVAVSMKLHTVIAVPLVLTAYYGGAYLTKQFTQMPDFPILSMPIIGVLLLGIWAGASWIQTSTLVARWSRPV
ncbi:MAG: hypothetical protein H0T53_16045 [Herpetosiphonaceae bacterium]|nr:hypothetical protein [Herpetosiphonaceae bacterium]